MSLVNMEALDDHSPVLFVLFRLAPNGDPNMLRLRDPLMRLHDVFDIFPEDLRFLASPVTCRRGSSTVASDVPAVLDAGQNQL